MTKERARQKAAKYLEWAELAEKKAEALSKQFYETYKDFDWTEPIKIGHHSQRRHEKVFEKRDNFFRVQIELEQKAKRFKEKAENLTRFANTNKGDAEAKREAQRQEMDKIISVGSRVYNFIYSRTGIVIKVNKKTYGIQFDDGLKATQPKHFCKPLNQ
jgi:membrane protein involved in colicin uptake